MDSEDTTTSIIIITRTTTLPETTITMSKTAESETIVWEESTVSTTIVTSRIKTIIRATSSTKSSIETSSSLTITETDAAFTESTTETASTASTSVKIGSTSDIPSDYNFGNASASSNSLQVGVAIGIPIAIFLIFFIAMGIWYFLRMKKGKNIMNHYNNEVVDDEHTLSDKPYPVVFSPGVYMKEPYQQQKPHIPQETRKTNRLSQMFQFPLRNTANMTSNLSNRLSVITPILLKKFNLGKRTQRDDESDDLNSMKSSMVEPQIISKETYSKTNPMVVPSFKFNKATTDMSTSSYYGQSVYTVIKSYTRRLNDELTISLSDKCVILEKHSDGWCKIRLLYGNKEGLVPKMCLQKMD